MSVAFDTVVVRPLDGMRRFFWRWSAKTRFGRACMRDRGLRLMVLALTHMAIGLSLTLLVPLWLLLLGPLVLGVPHIAGDIRFLIVRPPLPLGRLGVVLILGPLALMTGLRVAPPAWGLWRPELEILLGIAAIAGALGVARASLERRTVVFILLAGVTAIATMFANGAILAVAHGHNFVALAAWLVLYRRRATLGRTIAIGATYLAVCGLILGGAFDAILGAHMFGKAAGGLDIEYMAASLAPGVEPVLAIRVVAVFAFAQAFHYAVWVRLVPQQMDPRPAPPTFARTLGRAREDLGTWGFAAVVMLAVGVPVAAAVGDALDIRNLYLVAVIFHGWLELSVFGALALHRPGGARGAGGQAAPAPAGWGRT